jgi:hypothetical protein
LIDINTAFPKGLQIGAQFRQQWSVAIALLMLLRRFSGMAAATDHFQAELLKVPRPPSFGSEDR